MDEAFLTDDINKYLRAANSITKSLGGNVQFETREEFDNFMDSDESFIL